MLEAFHCLQIDIQSFDSCLIFHLTPFRLFAKLEIFAPRKDLPAKLSSNAPSVTSSLNFQVRINCFFPVLPRPFAWASSRAFGPFYSVSGLSISGARSITYLWKLRLRYILGRNKVTVLVNFPVNCQGCWSIPLFLLQYPYLLFLDMSILFLQLLRTS